ncbi:methyltransferase [Streptomyces sp. Lzd4kr]|nr:methyltransferase [Streptomyces sp. Lzd4kr]
MNASSPESAPSVPQSVPMVALYPMVSRAVYAVVSLGIPDLLKNGSRSSSDLAVVLDVKARPLHQILRTVATTGLLKTEPNGKFALTDDGRCLLEEHPSSSRDFILTAGGPAWYNGLGAIVESLKTGRTGFEITAGAPAFAFYGTHPEEAASFNRMMIAAHAGEPQAVVEAYDFGRVEHIVDVGGGIGTFLSNVLGATPTARGTLFDLPHAVEGARQVLGGSPVADRCSFVEGDFFAQVPAGDVHILSHVIHDWDDAESVKILTNCQASLNPDGRILVVEAILPDDDEPHPFKTLDVVLATLAGGSERTMKEFTDLFDSAGLQINDVIPTKSAVSVIELQPR